MKDEQEQSFDFTTEINQSLNKFAQGLKDGSKFQRKNALENVKKQVHNSYKSKDPAVLKFTPEAVKSIFRSSLNVLNDSIEKCRELTCELIAIILDNDANWDNEMTGGTSVKESSEEIRLQLYTISHRLLELKSKKNFNYFEIHLQEFVSILTNAFMDSYPEVKKMGCQCTKLLAKTLAGQNFHMQSESLVKPILLNLTHQHSRVRKDMVDCLCEVIMHGDNKSVDVAIPHLAQRFFDGATIVRMAVIKLCGTWLLDLPDRYSFHHKLIPLLLSGFSDETFEIKELTESLWWDIGIKYQKENETDMKDKLDFLEQNISNYPSEFADRRPNAGCRELIRLNASKIVPGILNDIGDWVEATRLKSIQLLYIMIWQCEANITQNLETALQTLFKASYEDTKEIHREVNNCAKLLGHFTDPNLSLRFAFKAVQKLDSPNPGVLVVLNGLMLGHNSNTPFQLVVDYLCLLDGISLTVDSKLQSKLVTCCDNLLPMSKFTLDADEELAKEFEYLIFKNVFTISALSTDANVIESVNSLVEKLKSSKLMEVCHMVRLIKELKTNCQAWNDNSLEPIIFAKLIKDCGLLNEIVNVVIEILKICLDPTKEAQLRARFLMLIPEIFFCSNCDDTEISKQTNFLETSIEVIINEMIIPNIIWKAGRSASAVRMSAIASLAYLIQTNTIRKIKVKVSTIESLVKLLSSVLDDDNKSTRLYVCKIYHIILKYFGSMLSKDQLHKLYPEFIKRLDDQNEEIRHEILTVFDVYMDSLNSNYDKILYQAHLQMIFENVLLYLDDSDLQIQQKVFNLLKKSSVLHSELLIKEIEKVKSKHRSSKYCDDLIVHCRSLS